MAVPDLTFPPGFLWGAGTSAHQIEGHNTYSDWWRSEQEGRIPVPSGDACESWALWQEDQRLVRDLGLNAYRFSVEWARIEPEPGQFNQAALGHYRQQVEALRAANIEPVVALHHFTSPLWLHEQGGWADPRVVQRFRAYTERVVDALGDLVTWWVSINEPTSLGGRGYIEGAWPPHRQHDLQSYVRQLHWSIRAHAAARQVVRARTPRALVGMTFDLNHMDPLRRWDPFGHFAVRVYERLREHFLTRAVPHMDYIGVNYYGMLKIASDPRPWRQPALRKTARLEGVTSDYTWNPTAVGLYHALRAASRFHKPLLITETGLTNEDEGARAEFIVQHVRQVHRALREGIDVRGFLYWSLIDNYEWTDGYAKRFGLYRVDFTTPGKPRTQRPSALALEQVARANGLVEQAPVPAR